MRCAILLASVFMLAATASFEETFDEENLVTKVPEESLLEELVDAPVKVSAKARQVFTEAELSAKGPYWKWTNKFKTKNDGKYRLREQHSSKKKVTKREWSLIESAKQTKAMSVRDESKHDKTRPPPHRLKDPSEGPPKKGMSARVEFDRRNHDNHEFIQTKAGRRRLCARLYEHSNFRGRVFHVYSNVRFVGWFNDKLSSMRVYGCTIRLYQHSHYRGRSHAYGPGSYNFNVIRRTIGNDQVSSVRVWHRRQRRRSRATRAIYRHGLWRENVFYFRQGRYVPRLSNRRANMARWKHYINYRNTGGRWPGFHRAHNFAVRWTGRVRFFRSGRYRFSLISDDGSKLWINNRYTINNDGLHGWRNREATRYIRAGWVMMRVEMFERGGHHGCLFRYRGPDTGNRWKVVRAGGTRTRSRARAIYRHGLWREAIYYFRQGRRVPHLANRRPNVQRWKHYINYRNTGGRWPGFHRAHNFAVRWTGRVRFFRSGRYRFSLISDDGSKLWINNRYTINNDGLHGWRNREATRYIRAGWVMMRVEMFEAGGHHGCLFRYRGPDTGNRWKVVKASGTRTRSRARRRPSRSRGCARGMYKKCYRPYRGRRNTVCAWVCR